MGMWLEQWPICQHILLYHILYNQNYDLENKCVFIFAHKLRKDVQDTEQAGRLFNEHMRRDVTCTSFDWPFDISLILGHEGSDMERKRLKRYYILTTTHNAKQHNTHSMYAQINFWHAQRWTSINLYYLYYISY